MKISYYPGCTLKTKAKNLEDPAIAAMAALDIEMEELPRWNCCGTVYSLADDDLIHMAAPFRNLIRITEQNDDKVITLCSFCYHTLRRVDQLVMQDEEKRKTLNLFMDEEIDYNGGVRVYHFLEILKDIIGFDTIKEKVNEPLLSLRVTPYYGCTLLRPVDVAIDNVERPTIMEEMLEAVGAMVVDDPMKTECCGSFQTVSDADLAIERGKEIIESATRRETDALVLTCPLCMYNLGNRQENIKQKYYDFKELPILYISQVLALALGLGEDVCRFDLNYPDPRPMLKEKEII